MRLRPLARRSAVALTAAVLTTQIAGTAASTARPSERSGRSATATLPAWLDRINQIRTAAGLPPVTENAAWTTGIDNHLTYLEKTPDSYQQGQHANAHTENPASPYYTASGDREAGSSDLAFSTVSDLDAIDDWLTAPFHAIGMLRPGLQQVAFARHDASGDAGLDVLSGLTYGTQTSPVVFPGPGSTINLRQFGGENPDPRPALSNIQAPTTRRPGWD